MLEAIRAGAPISRAEISRRAGISKPTVSLALQSLLDAGLVREAEAPATTDGPSYGAVFFEPVPEAALVLGLDLGARFLRGAMCDLARRGAGAPGRRARGADADAALEAIAALRDVAGGRRGAAAPSASTARSWACRASSTPQTGMVTSPTNVPGLEDAPSATSWPSAWACPVTLENDINLAALGERGVGVARGVDDFAFLSIGTGMGAGLVLDGELHRGRHGAAGEVDCALAGARAGRRSVRRRGRRPWPSASRPEHPAPQRAGPALRRARRSSPPRARGDALAQRGGRRGGAPHRACTSCRSRPWSPTPRWSCWAAGSAPTATCC